jgi:hypothetical protein
LSGFRKFFISSASDHDPTAVDPPSEPIRRGFFNPYFPAERRYGIREGALQEAQ